MSANFVPFHNAPLLCASMRRREPKTVNVAGNYNDIHDNTTVNQK